MGRAFDRVVFPVHDGGDADFLDRYLGEADVSRLAEAVRDVGLLAEFAVGKEDFDRRASREGTRTVAVAVGATWPGFEADCYAKGVGTMGARALLASLLPSGSPSDVEALSGRYLAVTGPVPCSGGSNCRFYADEEDSLVRRTARGRWDGLVPVGGAHATHPEALRAFWGSQAWRDTQPSFRGRRSPDAWPCAEPDDLVSSAILLRAHAPGVAVVDDHGRWGLAVARRDALEAHTARAAGKTGLPREGDLERPELRLAYAYVCCGQLPPSELVASALAVPPDAPVPAPFAAAFAKSLAAGRERYLAAEGVLEDAAPKGPSP